MSNQLTLFGLIVLLLHIHTSYSDTNGEDIGVPGPDSQHDNIVEENDSRPRVENNFAPRHHRKTHRDPVEVPPSRPKLFEETDANGDGFVTKQEYLVHNGIDENATDVDDLFITYDRDNDGRLSEQEFVEQSSPWDVIHECEFLVMERCNDELDQTMADSNNELGEPLCLGLQSYLNCVSKAETTNGHCDIESYIASVKQTALIYRSSGLCPKLDIGKLDFDIEIDYEPRDEITTEVEYEESDYSSNSDSTRRRHARSVEALGEETNLEERESNNLENHEDDLPMRECTLAVLEPCTVEFETDISKNIDTITNFEKYKECVSRMVSNCGHEQGRLLLKESLKIVAQKHIGMFYNNLTKDSTEDP